MSVTFSNTTPIFLQLAEMIKVDIVNGKFNINEKLPSVRDFAFKYSINPNTVQKALQLLEDDGLIVTDSTNGKFVTSDTRVIAKYKDKIIDQEVKNFFEKMKSLGLNAKEVKKIIKDMED